MGNVSYTPHARLHWFWFYLLTSLLHDRALFFGGVFLSGRVWINLDKSTTSITMLRLDRNQCHTMFLFIEVRNMLPFS